ncbi:MAG TPA: prephenate dehydrogenase/arogenate dehydrogenase family protein [Phycisphaerae bacterium]|nr:prephenate dehydrogenase/arogenate dehydrogenase family protein [Phycisphaerae bacterium]
MRVFERVVIVGVGLLGASLGMALRQRRAARRVTGVGRSGSPSVGIALERGAIDDAAGSVGEVAGAAELIVLCTPVRQFPEMLSGLRGRVGQGTVVTDVGSTKRQVMQWARETLGEAGGGRGAFVGSHPMAGSEKRGPEHARADLFEGATCFVCAGDGENGHAAKVESLWQQVGMRTVRTDAATHDKWVAQVSHGPHAVAFALMNAAARDPACLAAAAGSFADMTRVAGSDAEMWTDIFVTNRDAVVAALDGFSTELGHLREAIARGDDGAIGRTIGRARAERERFLAAFGQRKN